MDSNFEDLFQMAVTTSGESYKSYKTSILDMGQTSIPKLKEKIQKEDNWRGVLTAEILLGWLTHEALYKECSNYVKGVWPMKGLGRPITGKPNATARANMLYSLGSDVIPRLFEMLVKTGEYTNQTEMGAITGALRYFRDPKTIPPLIEILENEKEQDPLRVLVLGVMGEFDDDRTRESILKILSNKENSDQLRGSAGIILSSLKENRSLPPLTEIVRNPDNSQSLKLDAFLALGELGNEQAVKTLHDQLIYESDEVLIQAIISALGKVGNKSSIKILEEACKKYKDEDICEAVEDAKEEINDRFGST